MSDLPDYLIVGAGSAGCVLAARLTEDPATTVVILEAGPDYRAAEAPDSVRAISPMQVLTSSDDGAYRWDELAAVRTSRQSEVMLWRGRGAGGSSSVNGMLAVRPEGDDFDGWAAAGCTGWTWDDMSPWFNAIEHDLAFGHEPYHGDDGPIPVWRPDPEGWGDLERRGLTALLDLGYPYCPDHNAPGSTGFGPYAANIDTSDPDRPQRVSANSAYLEAARDRPNLTIIGDALVDRVAFDGGRADGVLYRRDGEERYLEARHVILAAGSPFTPAILLRSGVERPGIGKAIGDHPGFGVQIVYDRQHAAPPSNGRHINCFGRYTSGLAGGANDMAILAGARPEPLGGDRYAFQIQVALWQPFSAGELRLRDDDPASMPHIDTRMLSDERDALRMRDGFRRLMDVVRHPEMAAVPGRRSYGQQIAVIDDIEELASLDDAAVDRVLLESVYDTQHIVGGCRMGQADDDLAVVDPTCRLIGHSGLSVIDGSILPSCPRANTHFTVLAIAERMAAALR